MSDAARPTHAEAGRTLLAASSRGVLATISRDDGYPYASVVELAPTDDGDVILLLSGLAEHTKNFADDDRVSIVVTEDDSPGEVLALGRVTCKGRIRRVGDDEIRALYLDVHPSAERYVDFGDFSFYRVEIERSRFIGGFGRMSWVGRDEWSGAEPDPLREIAAGVIAHMNDDHAHNLVEYAHAFTDADWAERATMVRLDRLGFDMRVESDDRSSEVRVGFDEPLGDSDGVHEAMVRLARRAREVVGD